jgi:translation initiation factor 3 subunit A
LSVGVEGAQFNNLGVDTLFFLYKLISHIVSPSFHTMHHDALFTITRYRFFQIRGWEGWTTESIELHLQTRFSQLETASVLHLYTEGFRTVEDIYNILQISHARRKTTGAPPPKAKLMAAYYEKLTTLFWVSENYLFHAFAWYKYYSLCKEYNRGMSDEMKQMQASAVLLATLCIPAHDAASPSAASGSSNSKSSQQQQGHGISSTLEDDIIKEKMARMATLLGFHTRHPTREALLSEIRSNNNNIMESVPSYLRDLYLLLEENSDPLIMVEQAKPLLEQLKKELGATNETDNDDFDDNTLGRYVKPLTDVLLLKLLLNLSAAYHTVSMDHLKRLTEGLGVTFDQVEKAIVLFTQQTKTVSVRIDHRAGCLRFGDPELESEQMRSQLTTLSKKLQTLVDTTIAPSADSSASRSAFYESIRSKLVSEHEAILERKNLIESKKEEVERVAQEALREANRIKEVEAAARKVEEDKRLQREQRVREKEKMRKIQMEMEATEKKKYLQAMGRNIESMTEEEVANIDTAALAKEHADKANKKREDAERKQREAAKRLDYLVRAVRIEELPLIEKKYDEKIASDRARYEADVVEKAKRAKEQWLADVKEKEALNVHSVFKYLDAFEDLSMVGRKKMHRELCKAEDQRAEMDSEKGKLDRARSRKDEEEKMRAAEEAKIRAEEEAVQLVEEKARRDEEKRRKAAEEEKRRQAELSRMQDERDRKENERRPPPGSRQLDAAQGGGGYKPPSMRGGGGGGSRMGGGSDRLDRGGGYGGGRYEGRQQGDGDRGGSGDGGGSHWGTGGGDRGGGDRDRRGGGDSYGARRDDRGGSSSGGGGAWRK